MKNTKNSRLVTYSEEYWAITRLQSSWGAIMVILFLSSFPEITDSKVGIILFFTLLTISTITFIAALKPIYDFFNQDNSKNDKQEVSINASYFQKTEKGIRFLDYLKNYPKEHPYICMSIVGVFFYLYYTDYMLLHSYIPIGILVLLLADYSATIKSVSIRLPLMILLFILTPVAFATFLIGLIAPFIIVCYKFISLGNIESIQTLFQNPINFWWSIFYPFMCFQFLGFRMDIIAEERRELDSAV